MAVNETRSMNADLREGLTDGVVKKLEPDRGGARTNLVLDAQMKRLLPTQLGLYDFSISEHAKQAMADRLTRLQG